MSDDPYLVIDGLTAGYGGPPIIEDITLEAKPGAITAIVGPSSAGKSTLMKPIAGVVRPSGGEIKVCGKVTTGLAADRLVRHCMAYVPQVANVFPSLTVLENLEMGAYTRKSGVRARCWRPPGSTPSSWTSSRNSAWFGGGADSTAPKRSSWHGWWPSSAGSVSRPGTCGRSRPRRSVRRR